MSKFQYSSFQTNKNNILNEPMFFGENVNISRFDQQRFPIFEKLIEKQLSFFWRPEEVDLSKDRMDFKCFTEVEKHIFISNLQYQILLDSIQGRSPNMAFLPLVSLPELETWIETWSFSETIHSRSYTHLIRSIMDSPEVIFNGIVDNDSIKNRAKDVSFYYDDLILKTQLLQSQGEGYHQVEDKTYHISIYEVKKSLYFALHAVNALEAIRFYVSFACTFAFSEQKKIEGCSKIMKLIARDEALHLTGTQQIINTIIQGKDGDLEMAKIAKTHKEDVYRIFEDAISQEKQWAKFLFKKGSILGLNEMILCQYIDFLAKERMSAVGLEYKNKNTPKINPLPWIDSYFESENVQVAPQEVEISSYLVGQIDSNIEQEAFSGFIL
jgi:ribonucleoside-diphosphate reductase beta chain